MEPDEDTLEYGYAVATPRERVGAGPLERAAPSASRSGTHAAPHVRADGQATRSTTVHLPVDLHQELRLEAAHRGEHMSAIVAEAVRERGTKGVVSRIRKGDLDRVTAYLPVELGAELRMRCAGKRIELSEAIAEAVRAWLDRD